MANVAASGSGRPVATAVVAAGDAGRRRRRPSGEPPPLPRHVTRSTRWYLLALAATVALEVAMAVHPARRALTAADDAVLRALDRLRNEPTRHVMDVLRWAGDPAVVRVLGWATILALLINRRFRHLLVYLATGLVVVVGTGSLAVLIGRMRPTAVPVLAAWSGYAHPSVPVAALAGELVGVLHTLVPAGTWRRRATWLAAAIVGALCLARMWLGLDHPTDVLAALGLGWALPSIVYLLAVPDEAFPITYRATHGAHLDVSGARGRAIVHALDQQLGIAVERVEPFGQEGSAGSTPLRLRTRGDRGQPVTLFAKLYAVNHLRADRSYKLARMVLYGRLEDEKPFSTVRRLVEYEDHLLRLLRDAHLPVPRPYGFVEITPEREYLIVMEFLADARTIGSAPLTEAEIDSGLGIVRTLWQAGVAHRDIKPSNLLVRDGRIALIDVAFATIRPTPWRQAVDLANMMLTLALASTPETVYARAERIFSPDDIAEAFAATRSVTVPTQLRARLRADGRDLITRFRALAPRRSPVTIQLWSVRRVLVSAGLLLAALSAAGLLYAYAQLAGLL